MDAFIARQPIFDSEIDLFAYELLFRSGWTNAYSGTDPDQSTREVIVNSSMVFELDTLVGGKLAFINLSTDVLRCRDLLILPANRVVAEILETIEPDEELIAAVKAVKEAGFTVALDDFVDAPRFAPLVDLTDIIKVDWMVSPPAERRRMAEVYLPRGIKLLAEKVESREEFEEARDLGYDYFQGYFFAKPEILHRKKLATSKLAHFNALKELQKPELDLDKLECILKRDLGLSFKLLRYINSAFFGFKAEVQSVRHALTLLGQRELKRWLKLVLMASLAKGHPTELLYQALFRSRFLELLAPIFAPGRNQDLFLVGLFSLIDTLIGQDMASLLTDLPLPLEVNHTLLRLPQAPYLPALECCEAMERAQWENLEGVDTDERRQVAQVYLEALLWAQGATNELDD